MTYNFDPERWFEIESSAIEARRTSGELSSAAHERCMAELLEKYVALLERIHIRHEY